MENWEIFLLLGKLELVSFCFSICLFIYFFCLFPIVLQSSLKLLLYSCPLSFDPPRV